MPLAGFEPPNRSKTATADPRLDREVTVIAQI